MGVPLAVQSAYDISLDHAKALQAIVGAAVQRWASSNEYLFKDRIKTAPSVSEKLETGRYSRWQELDDLYGCTIVIPTASHVQGALNFLRSAFSEHEVRGQGISHKPPDVFRFDAPRFIGKLRPQPESERPPGVEDILFEVQILTAFEYAWHVATHDLVFKGGHVDWRRSRLAAHLKAAAEEADALIGAFELTAENIPISPHRDTSRTEQIAAFFREAHASGRIPDALVPASWARFSANVLRLVESYSGQRVDEELEALLAGADSFLSAGSVPVSGSLFQLVTGVVVTQRGKDGLRRFVIVDSSELRDLYSVPSVPRAFAFE